MYSKIIEEKLTKLKFNKHNYDKYTLYLQNYVSASIYANESLEKVNFYLIHLSNNDVKMIKTINNYIILDKVDDCYIMSREVLGIPNWFINSVYKVSFQGKELTVEPSSIKTVNVLLNNVIEPVSIKYVGVSNRYEEIPPVEIIADITSLLGLSYNEIKSCIDYTYESKVKKLGYSFLALDYEAQYLSLNYNLKD